MSAERLAAAHAKVAAAEKKLAAASKASEAAREFADRIAVELVGCQQRHQDLADIRAAALMRSLKVGSKPKMAAAPKLADDYVSKLDAEHRSAAATQALHSLCRGAGLLRIRCARVNAFSRSGKGDACGAGCRAIGASQAIVRFPLL